MNNQKAVTLVLKPDPRYLKIHYVIDFQRDLVIL